MKGGAVGQPGRLSLDNVILLIPQPFALASPVRIDTFRQDADNPCTGAISSVG